MIINQKTIFMKLILYSLLAILSFTACSKKNDLPLESPMKRSFFKSDKDVLTKAQSVVANFVKDEQISRIDKIEYYDTKSKTLALIYYYSNKGYSNVGIERTFDANGQYREAEGVGIKCTGTCGQANCQVHALIVNGELQYAECSCSGCQMHINTN